MERKKKRRVFWKSMKNLKAYFAKESGYFLMERKEMFRGYFFSAFEERFVGKGKGTEKDEIENKEEIGDKKKKEKKLM